MRRRARATERPASTMQMLALLQSAQPDIHNCGKVAKKSSMDNTKSQYAPQWMLLPRMARWGTLRAPCSRQQLARGLQH